MAATSGVDGVRKNSQEAVGTLPTVVVTASPINDNEDDGYNFLHRFRSFSPVFTLSALPASAIKTSEGVKKAASNFIVLSTAGKGPDAIKSVSSGNTNQTAEQIDQEFKTVDLVNEFNKESPGRFDLFMDNIQIETLMAFSQNTNLTMATKVEFEVFEPMSINGLIEAMQVASMAAGHRNYMGTPFCLKVEFKGIKDTDKGATDKSTTFESCTRYFVITITKIDVEMNENGTKYRCHAVPHNELGYGDQNTIKEDVQIKGKNVGEILKSLMDTLTLSSIDSVKKELKTNPNTGVTLDKKMYDEYQVLFPTKKEDGTYEYGSAEDPKTWNKNIAGAKIHALQETPAVYSFPYHGEVADAYQKNAGGGRGFVNPTQVQFTDNENQPGATHAYSASNSSAFFVAGAKIHDIISSVVRDSEFGVRILKDPEKSIKDQFVDYVHIAMETEIKDTWNSVLNRPSYIYKFIVLPYKLHFSRIPLLQKYLTKTEQSKLELKTRRKYSFLYTGENVDIKSFNLRFNNLFYQAYPKGMGLVQFPQSNTSGDGANSGKVVSETPGTPARKSKASSGNVDVPMSQKINQVKPIVATGGNATRPSYTTYDLLVKNMHQAILDNLDMVTCEIEILGDPYFLCTGGIGNYRPKLIDDFTITENFEAPYQTGDVLVLIEFRNPRDINKETGLIEFEKIKVPFSGCFRVIKAVSKFTDGLFTQRLELIRIPGQYINAGASESTTSYAGIVDAPVNRTDLTTSKAP